MLGAHRAASFGSWGTRTDGAACKAWEALGWTADEIIEALKERIGDPHRRVEIPRIAGSSLLEQASAMATSIAHSAFAAWQEGRSSRPSLRAEKAGPALANWLGYQLPPRPPLSPLAIDMLAGKLGFELPPLLRRMYGEVADGGFGPSDGLLPLDHAVEEYLDRRLKGGPRAGEQWPPGFLPLIDPEHSFHGIDLRSGAILFFDLDVVISSSRRWGAAFKPAYPGLVEWFEDWLSGAAGQRRQAAGASRDRMNASFREEFEAHLKMLDSLSIEERRARGLPDVGWENMLRKANGLGRLS